MTGSFVETFLDDIIVYSQTAREHVHHVARVLERLNTFGLVANREKCEIGQRKMPFLGRLVTTEGNSATLESIQAMIDAPPPITKKQLQTFLRLCAWVRDHVPRAAEALVPLTDLLKFQRWRWNSE